ncbi:MAG TPA: hypothetical protein VFC19_52720 [Candidatus Limnocylindrales bacterium]|nr:hypothetical protein [Candidatus Limnocylindrales bacterium]
MRSRGLSNPFAFYLLFADGVARAHEQGSDFDWSQPRPIWARHRRPGGPSRRDADQRAV